MSLLKLSYLAPWKTAQLGKYGDCSVTEGYYHLSFLFFSLLKSGLPKVIQAGFELAASLACLSSAVIIAMSSHLLHFNFQPQT